MSCRTSKEIRDGRTAFESKQFAVAVDLLNTEFNNEKDDLKKAELAYLLGESYRQNNETSESVKWYDKAVELGYGPKALYEMGYGLKKLQKYGLAARYFEEILKTSDRTNEIQQEIRKCREAERLQNSGLSSEYEIELMSLNTSASEYSPYLFSDQELLFVNDNNTSSNRMYKWTGRGFSDIMLYNINTGTTSSFSDKINTAENEGAVAFNKEKTKIFFSRCYDEERDHYCKILMSELKKDKWSTPTPVFPMDPKLNYRDPVLIENDSVLIFSCDDPTGYGGTDLYYSVFENDTGRHRI
jgi:tetratricopeptide (TPR) repeat protein